MRLRGTTVFLLIIVLLAGAIYLTAYLNQPSHELTQEQLEIERKLALLPIPSPIPAPPSPTPTPVPISAKTNSDELIEILYDKEHLGSGYDRVAAARRLGELRANSAVPVLLEMLDDKTWFASQEIRDACAISLGLIGDPETIDDLTKTMKSRNVPAAQALLMMNTEDSRKELLSYFKSIQGYKKSKYGEMILALISMFGDLRMDESVDQLVRAVKRDDFEIGCSALTALRSIGDIQAVPDLIKMDQAAYPMRSEIVKTINALLLKNRDFTQNFSDRFNEEKWQTWTTHRDHYRSAVVENRELSLFSSIPDDRLEMIGNIDLEGDYDLNLQFRIIKGKPDAQFGIIIAANNKEHLEFRLKPVQSKEKAYLKIEAFRIRGSKSSRIFRNTSPEIQYSRSSFQIRIIDSIVTIFAGGKYIQSFQSTNTNGAVGFFIIGENHVAFDDLVIQKIDGPRVLSGEPVKKDEKADKYIPPQKTSRSERQASESEEKPRSQRKTPDRAEKTAKIVIDIKAEYVSVNEVVFKLDGEVLSKITGNDLKSKSTKGFFNFRKIYTGSTRKTITPGKHTLSGYVVGKSKTKGASTTFHIARGETKRFSFVSEKDKDRIIAK